MAESYLKDKKRVLPVAQELVGRGYTIVATAGTAAWLREHGIDCTQINKVLEGKGNYGYNAANGTYGDMIEMGILDPTKVTRTALQNAASVASLMLTTECMVAEAPKEESGAGGMPGGGMGGMGGMGMDM